MYAFWSYPPFTTSHLIEVVLSTSVNERHHSRVLHSFVVPFGKCSDLSVSMLVMNGAKGIILRDLTYASCFAKTVWICSVDILSKANLGRYTPILLPLRKFKSAWLKLWTYCSPHKIARWSIFCSRGVWRCRKMSKYGVASGS